MTQSSKHCVDAAIAFANKKEHGGAGYHLRVVLENGETVEGPHTPLDDQPDVLFLLVGTENPDEVFIDKHRIMKATIVW